MSEYRDVYNNSFALAIGINTYTDPRFAPLGQAEQDAKNFADLIMAPPFGFDVTLLLGKDATRDAIETALFQLRATMPDDRVLVYFAGHGYTLIDEFKQETGYLAAADTVPEKDYTALELEAVTGLTRRAKAKHIAFIFDACFSGQALGLTRSATDTSSDKFLQRRAFQVVSAGAGDQTVSDVRSMTGVLIEGLRSGVADEDGLVTLSELGLYLQTTIAADSGKTQIPQFGHLRGSQGGEFVFYQDTSVRLPTDLVSALASTRDAIREGGVEALLQLAQGENPDLAKLAQTRLDIIAKEDPSAKVRAAARGQLQVTAADDDTVYREPGKPRPVAASVTPPPPPGQHHAPARPKKGHKNMFGVSTPVLLGGIGAALLLGIGGLVCLFSVLFPPVVTPTIAPTELATELATEVSSGGGTLVPMTDEPTAPPDEQASIKAEINAVLDKAYKLKASTLHDLTTDGLADAYTGKELEFRIYAVELAKKENCYWEVSLDQPDKVTFIFIGEDQARVSVLRVETRLHYCNDAPDEKWTHKHDRYINYIDLAFADGRWLVSRILVSDLDPD